jgi:hypothetical protein
MALNALLTVSLGTSVPACAIWGSRSRPFECERRRHRQQLFRYHRHWRCRATNWLEALTQAATADTFDEFPELPTRTCVFLLLRPILALALRQKTRRIRCRLTRHRGTPLLVRRGMFQSASRKGGTRLIHRQSERLRFSFCLLSIRRPLALMLI